LVEVVVTYDELYQKTTLLTKNLDFRGSSHVLLPKAVESYGEFGGIQGNPENVIFEVVRTYFYVLISVTHIQSLKF